MTGRELAVLIVAVLVLVLIAAILRLRRRSAMEINGPLRSDRGTHVLDTLPTGPGVRVEDSESRRGGLAAHDDTGRGVEVRRVSVAKDIQVRSSSPERTDSARRRAGGAAGHARALVKDVTAAGNVTSVAAQSVDVVAGNKIVHVHVHGMYAGAAPPAPALCVGRVRELQALRERLLDMGTGDQAAANVTTLHGLPGVGKTTLTCVVANDEVVIDAFQDGVLWASLGPTPNLLSVLTLWGRSVGLGGLLKATTVREATTLLAGWLRRRRVLLIVDDVWDVAHGAVFQQTRGARCALLFTSRLSSVAEALAPASGAVITVPVLTEADALELLGLLAPAVVREHPLEAQALVRDLEFLPLGLQVAGRLLHTEAVQGWGVKELLNELRDAARLLSEDAPPDRIDSDSCGIPTVQALLHKSTDRLAPEMREHFAYLGVFAPKPATFDLEALRSVWELADPKPVTQELVGRGLLEPLGSGRFQMHTLLVAHARSLLRPGRA